MRVRASLLAWLSFALMCLFARETLAAPSGDGWVPCAVPGDEFCILPSVGVAYEFHQDYPIWDEAACAVSGVAPQTGLAQPAYWLYQQSSVYCPATDVASSIPVLTWYRELLPVSPPASAPSAAASSPATTGDVQRVELVLWALAGLSMWALAAHGFGVGRGSL